MDECLLEEVGTPIKIKEIEKEALKQLNSGSIMIKTKEVAKTAGEVALMVIVAAALIAALGAGTAYADKHMS